MGALGINSGRTGDAAAIAKSLRTPEAFGAIFERHFGAIHRYLARRVGRERADDLAAQTFSVAFERRATFRLESADARPWLFGIATKLLANNRRAEQRLLEAIARLEASPSGCADPVPSAADWECELAAALAKLDPSQRDVLLLHVWCELSYEQIAGSLEIPLGTVRSRIARARAGLRADLESVADSTPAKQEAP